MSRWLFAGLFCLAVSGCAVGPDYERPDIPVPTEFRGTAAEAASVADAGWWTLIEDPVLDALVREAIANNLDLAVATERIAEARARYRIVRADLIPEVGASGGQTSQRNSVLTDPARPGFDRASNNYDASVAVSWEIDLFGGNRRRSESAFASYLATEHGQRATLVTLVGDVASAYVTLRALDLQLEIARETVKANEEMVDYYRKRLAGGLSNRLEVDTAIANKARTAILVPQFEQQIASTENALSFLLGRVPGDIDRGAAIETFRRQPAVPPGLPAALLERRPDVLAAEQQLVAANADVGAARALFFPSLSVSGVLGAASGDAGDLFDEGTETSQLRTSVLAPIFQGGRLRANQAVAESRLEQAVLRYRATALNAYREVADAVVAVDKLGVVRTELQTGVDALEDASTLARARYQEGLSSYLEILNTDQQLLDQRLRLASTRGDELRSLVALYRALGGGWQEPGTP
jgi:multidrug efflux system outer membrane protein